MNFAALVEKKDPVRCCLELIRKMKRNYRNLRIFKKLITANFLILCAFSLIALTGLQVTIDIYNDQLYEKSVQVLEEFTVGVGNDLRDVENFSLDTALNSQVQTQLVQLLAMPDSYDESRGASTLRNILLLQSLSTNTLSSICYVNTRGKSFNIGENSGSISDAVRDELIDEARKAKGGYVCLPPDPESQYIYSSREILEYGNTSLRSLGTLLFCCDLNAIIQKNHHVLPDDKTILCIYQGQKLIYQNSRGPKTGGVNFGDENQGYSIGTIAGKKYFVAYIRSDYPGWTYVSLFPYESLFRTTSSLRNVMVACFICLSLLSAYLSYKTARNITKPLEDLTLSMKQAETGDFQNVKDELFDYDRTDEVGYLQKDFLKMIRQINKLIKENYEKQIVIKDTEYKALQSQIDPHFMYNTLSSVNWLARTGKNEEISSLVISLGNLMRASIGKTPVIPLKEEVQLLRYYINIQNFRYQDRAEFTIRSDPKHDRCIVPKMILQPIVENSIKYGVEQMLEICRISVYSVDEGENISIAIEDNGPGMEEEFLERLRKFDVQAKGTGIGLKNIDDRLKIQFGKEFGLTIDSKAGIGTKVTIHMPKRGV